MGKLFSRLILAVAAILLPLSSIIIPASKTIAVTYEDFTTWTEVDASSKVTITSDSVNWTDEGRAITAYVYKDKGINYFSGSFDILLTARCKTSTAGDDGVTYWSVSNGIGTWRSIYVVGADDIIGLTEEHPSSPNEIRWYLREQANGSDYSSGTYFVPTTDTPYFLRIVRDETVGTYGTIYCYIYSDYNRTSLVQTLSLALHKKADFRYIYAHMSYGNTGSYYFTGSTSDMAITLMSGIGYAPTVLTYNAINRNDGALLQGWASTGDGALTNAGFDFGIQSGNYTDEYFADDYSGNAFADLVPDGDLTIGQTYYFRAKAENSYGWGYGSEKSFVYSPFLLDVEIASFDFSQGHATDNCSASFIVHVTPNNVADNVSARMSTNGITWTPLTELKLVSTGAVDSDTSYYLYTTWETASSNSFILAPDTKYYIQGYAYYDGIGYFSPVKSFTTTAPQERTKPIVSVVSIRDITNPNNDYHTIEFTGHVATDNTTDWILNQGVIFSLYKSSGILLEPIYRYYASSRNSDGTFVLTLSFEYATWYNSETLHYQAFVNTPVWGEVRSIVVSFTPTPLDDDDGDGGGVVTDGNWIDWLKGLFGLSGAMGTWALMGILVLLISLVYGVAIVGSDNAKVKAGAGIAWLITTVAAVGAFIFTGQLGIWPIVILVGGFVGLGMILLSAKLSGGGGN